mmetsp:Transcript_19047/g.38713  ORF Transcript_19047/g.38713 Transcript_19047/m.38713 type:complete len:235 (+) Transcript_19047:257-961(+)
MQRAFLEYDTYFLSVRPHPRCALHATSWNRVAHCFRAGDGASSQEHTRRLNAYGDQSSWLLDKPSWLECCRHAFAANPHNEDLCLSPANLSIAFPPFSNHFASRCTSKPAFFLSFNCHSSPDHFSDLPLGGLQSRTEHVCAVAKVVKRLGLCVESVAHVLAHAFKIGHHARQVVQVPVLLIFHLGQLSLPIFAVRLLFNTSRACSPHVTAGSASTGRLTGCTRAIKLGGFCSTG